MDTARKTEFARPNIEHRKYEKRPARRTKKARGNKRTEKAKLRPEAKMQRQIATHIVLLVSFFFTFFLHFCAMNVSRLCRK